MALRCTSLASGSSGNAFLVSSGTTRVLIDAGLSYSRLRALAADAGDDCLDRMDGIIVTHEHGDHIKGVGVCARKTGCPVFTTHGTLSRLQRKLNGTERVSVIGNSQSFAVGDITFEAFGTLHDAEDPIGLVATHGGRKLGFATDLGMMTGIVRDRLAGSHLLVLEANHDEDMLMANTRYPQSLKQRILGSRGHLSNNTARVMLESFLGNGLHTVMLAHLSSENNRHDLVHGTMHSLLEEKGAHDTRLIVLKQDCPSGFVTV